MEQVSENIYVETAYIGCNVGFIVTSEGVVMINTPQIPEDAVKWRDIIGQYGRVIYIINTEPHQDHFTGNCFFEGASIGHEGTREAILSASLGPFKAYLEENFPGSVPLMEEFSFRPPDITLNQRMTIHLGEQSIHLITLPGHTACEVAVHLPGEGVVFTTDNLFGGVQPGLQQALPYEWLESLEKIGEMAAEVLVPGHGHICGPDSLIEMSNFLQDWIDAVQDAI